MHIFLYFFSKIMANTFDFFVLRQLTSTIYMAIMRSFYIRQRISIFIRKKTPGCLSLRLSSEMYREPGSSCHLSFVHYRYTPAYLFKRITISP